MKPSSFAPALQDAYRSLSEGIAAVRYGVRISPCEFWSIWRVSHPPRRHSALRLRLLGLSACLCMIPQSQAANRGGGEMPAFAAGYRAPSLVNAGTVVASGGSPQVHAPISAGNVTASGSSPQVHAPISAGNVIASGGSPQVNAPIFAGTVIAHGGF